MTFSRGNARGAKLTPALVLEMREDYKKGATQGSLSRKYGVSLGQVGRIVRGESWQSFSGAVEASDAEVNASLTRFQAALDKIPTTEADLTKLKEDK